MAYQSQIQRRIAEAFADLPQIDVEAARRAMMQGSDGSEFGLPAGYQFIVAMHDAQAMLQDAEKRKQQLENAIFAFKRLFSGGAEWPGAKVKTVKNRSHAGRPPVDIECVKRAARLIEGGATISEAARAVGVHRNTLSPYLKQAKSANAKT